jgi:gliding motility-associated lipoprotein GldH
MRIAFTLCAALVFLASCDDARVYEEVFDFNERQWVVDEKPVFEFVIDDADQRYNIYGNVRNSVSYPYSRLFFTYYLLDSTGVEIQKDLVSEFLFDAKTGEPQGRSGIGDLYDHQFILLKAYQFNTPGKYKIALEQFMRMDTLAGILAVGIRVEKATRSNE